MSTLVQKCRAITQSTTNETSIAQVIEFVSDGVGYVISHVPKELLSPYSTETSFTTSSGVAHGNNTVLGVRRGSYESIEVDKSEAGWLESGSGSYMIPTAQFPKHYERGGVIFLKPNPTTGTAGYLNYITAPTITSGTSNALGNLEHIVVNRASGYDFKAMGSYFSEKGSSQLGLAVTGITTAFANFTSTLPDDWDYTLTITTITSALSQAQQLINGNLPGSLSDAVAWIADEDSEMVGSVVGTASQEISRAVQEIAKERLRIENETAERGTDLSKAKAYLEEVSARMQQAQNGIQYIQKAQQVFAEGERAFTLSEREVETHIKNSSEMIAMKHKEAMR